MSYILNMGKSNKKSVKMYGFNSLEKVIMECEEKEAIIRKEKAAHIDLLNKRFFDFLMSIFYEFRDYGINLIFNNNDMELKLMDLKNERTYWLIFDDKVSGEKMEYLVQGYVSSCTITKVYRRIIDEVVPIYEKNKAIYERKERLKNELNNFDELNSFDMKKEKLKEKNGRGKI